MISLSLENQLNLTEGNYHIKIIGYFIGALIIAVTCFIDDVKNVSAIIKLIMQIIAATVVILCGIKIDVSNLQIFSGLSESYNLLNTISIIVTFGWIVGITNAINLIDGLDGLSSGISIISCVSMLIIFILNNSPMVAIVLITALIGALTGFLPYNLNPAKTFIGDTGSNFLGFSIAIISILGVAKTYTAFVVVAPIIILGLPIFDTLFAIIRRIVKNKSIKGVMKPDAGHVHHKLLQHGFSQKEAVIILYCVSTCLGMFAIIYLESGLGKALSFLLIAIAAFALGIQEFISTFKDVENNKQREVKSDK